ncbi:amino acid adenylation domain-containing protein [Nocardiopsis ansamitocini]|uniref:Carrier domain-containing protein n=1 Tax=Nocardiopsis ansamitocini TaxID=1670832 RepID=A0A9W6P7X9_9ACTN|nr:amino acid adenylation domain-containing protein [Nocardiopsis ansamitocini]GLU48638.1 hypothetical protein Nans01_29890 [Nocardiopsis ansamitocini]
MTQPARTLPQALARAARLRPDQTALTDHDRAYDYRSLARSADQVAVRLRDQGVRAGDRVALLGPRDARLLVLLHGVLRAGATVVATDAQWSAADLGSRLRSVGARHAVCSEEPPHELPGLRAEVVDVDALAPDDSPVALGFETPGAGDTAYLSFTSGSTGRPKAVAITHANTLHYALGVRERLGLGGADAPRIAHLTTLAADLGHTCWLLALVTAGSVHVVPEDCRRDAEALWASLRDARVSMLKTTPSHMAALLEERPDSSPALDTVILGGEPLPRLLAERLLTKGVGRRLVNHYGPTETTIGATCFIASSVEDLPGDEESVPIGTAIGAARPRLLDGEGNPVADGSDGELYIGGPGVGLGYFDCPAETARGFVRHAGDRVYRTGDLCRRRPDGDLVFLGRADRQVKVRGFRVDPAGVERVIGGCPGVVQGVVVARDAPGGTTLLAAVRTAEGHDSDATVQVLRAHLRDRLPEYSVPAPIVVLAEFPVDANGKLDRPRLEAAVDRVVRASAGPADGGRAAAEPSHTCLTRTIGELWAEALGLPAVDPDADVLHLGGDSLLAMRTIAYLRREGHRVSFDDFYRNPTPARLAAAAAATTAPRQAVAAPVVARHDRLAPAQRWLSSRGIDDPRHWNQSVLLRCGRRVRAKALSAAVTAVLERHPALRRPIGPDGPGAARPAPGLDAVSFSRIEAAGPEPICETITRTCTELHRSLDPPSGRLLRVHLFSGAPSTQDRLALIAHHLVVDGLSWRILLEDLAHAYRTALSGEQPVLPLTADFYQWAAGLPPAPAPPARTASPLPVDDPVGPVEPAALTWALDRRGTQRLISGHGGAHGLEALLLSAFADATCRWSEQPWVEVEVETHGRDTSGSSPHLDTVGWFTAVKRVRLDGLHGSDVPVPARVREAENRVRAAPELPMDAAGQSPEAAFNFLGTFRLPDEPSLAWTPADEQAGTARCRSGDTLYRLRLTARVVDGRLVTDLVYAWPRTAHAGALDVMSGFSRAVASAARTAAPPPVRAPSTTSGQILHTGRHPAPGRVRVGREPVDVLLTGATGYVGGHLLTALVDRGARVTCLVRGERDMDAAARLDIPRGAVDTVAGDINREGLGLSAHGLAHARRADIVVHAAADVRLVASPAELERTNHTAVRRLLAWIDTETRAATLHHLSTLAVAGTVGGGPRRFSEADLRIGQNFTTPYERVKLAAEETVRAWAASGRRCCIHRSGHIAAHSRTGAFQHNIADNRVYQLVRGYVQAGAAPSRPAETFAFSYADTVAAGIAALATHPYTAPGVYHVETPYSVPHDDLVRWMTDHGYPIALTDGPTFAAALARAERENPETARLTAAWSHAARRNVEIDCSYTTAALERLGVRFTPPTPAWWSRCLDWAQSTGFLPTAVSCARPV